MKYIIRLLLIAFICFSCSGNTNIISPNERVEARVFILEDGQLSYVVLKSGITVVDTSQLGILVDDKVLGKNSIIKKVDKKDVEFEYALWGAKSKAKHNANKVNYQIKEDDGFIWNLEFQVSDEGVAFRYIVPNDGVKRVYGELSSFKVPIKTKVWYFERNNSWKLKSHAGEWLSADISKMPTISKMGPIQGLTLTLESPQGDYALLAEAALFNYSGMRLKAIGDNTFKANFEEGENGFEVKGNITTPWRCILLANDLTQLVNNSLVASLNPAPDKKIFDDTSWIKPGKSAWFWWSRRRSTFEQEKKVIDDAALLGLDYTLVDEGWDIWENKWQKVAELCEYAKTKNIGVFFWKHSNYLNFPENDYAVMTGFLDTISSLGAVGIKVDFMNGQDKSLIEFDETLLYKCAERQLMVDFHGCQQSSGEFRTYPNEVTREGVRGLELNGHPEGPITASHNAALPFTRYVTGHADYTPLAFTSPAETTWAHQLATLVCFYSPFQCLAENTEFLLHNEEVQPARAFIADVPSVWDETLVFPQSKIGELAILARRKGEDWYVGVLNAQDEMELSIPCDFLRDRNYEVDVFSDDMSGKVISLEGVHQNPKAFYEEYSFAIPFVKSEKMMKNTSEINLRLAKNGGAVIWFKAK